MDTNDTNPPTERADGADRADGSDDAGRWSRWNQFTTIGRLALPPLRRAAVPLAVVAALGAGGAWLAAQRVEIPRGEQLVRSNALTGRTEVLGNGSAWVLPGLHDARLLPARDLQLRAAKLARHDSPQALQTVEGLSVGLEVTLRVGLDEKRLPQLARSLPEAIGPELVEPQLAGILYQEVSKHTVRELFSTQRGEIQQRVEAALRKSLAADGVVLKDLQFGAVDLPEDYRKGLDALLAEGLASDKMRFTLELREKQVHETALRANAERERREIEADATAREQVIAARAQEETMKHVLPFKQRQIEQRQLEAEAERQSRVKLAEGAAQARRIEAEGEASARQKLADAEAYRLTQLGQVATTQMAREGELISRHPLLVQKALVDKLADKVQVIVAPPGTSGQLFTSLTGNLASAPVAQTADAEGKE
jgi:regulator of protease activity HflC (stomatin/prohibitin superfamily)